MTHVDEYVDTINEILDEYLDIGDYEGADRITATIISASIQMDWEIEYVIDQESYP